MADLMLLSYDKKYFMDEKIYYTNVVVSDSLLGVVGSSFRQLKAVRWDTTTGILTAFLFDDRMSTVDFQLGLTNLEENKDNAVEYADLASVLYAGK